MAEFDRNAAVLVTGSGGVLGRSVLNRLQQEGFTRIFSPSRAEMNLLNLDSTIDYLNKIRPKAVIHLASVVFGLGGNLKHQMLSAIENTTINNNIFVGLQRFPVERFFFAGTVASYPFPYREVPLREDSFFDGLPHYGEFGYAMSKRHAYTYLHILGEEIGLRYTYGIFTNLYGPHDRFDIENGHVIPSLIAKAYTAARSGSALEVWGDGTALRDFLHVEDAAKAVLFCLDRDDENRLINISSGTGVSIRCIAEIIAEASNIKELLFSSDKPVGIPNRVVDNKKLIHLGFTSSISIENGLSNACKWYASNIKDIRR